MYHVERSSGPFRKALGQEGEVGYLGADKEHGGCVRAGGNAGAAADAGSRIQGRLRSLSRDRDGVCVRGASGVDRDIAPGLDDPVKRGPVDCQVFDDREGPGPERLDDQGVVVLEMTHVKLAQGGLLFRAVRLSVDHGTAHAADPFSAVMVKGDRVFSFQGKALVYNIEHLQKGHVLRDRSGFIGLEPAFRFPVLLPPNLQSQGDRAHL